jgi:hypothetical protein
VILALALPGAHELHHAPDERRAGEEWRLLRSLARNPSLAVEDAGIARKLIYARESFTAHSRQFIAQEFLLNGYDMRGAIHSACLRALIPRAKLPSVFAFLYSDKIQEPKLTLNRKR